ncbi:flotillin family protein [Aphanothece sacrum]|uniref:Band 7 domain-containing protein n=1 Tax=Aphanothece sacrum FPU1 TaxID=1920663 RepID=A0A401IG20_APHSA|nr:SPFH domain-containing protein [Aphanothece sacrum]GBF80233.1 hypothetical protein AsFPU1_1634 [Aphanothece sacrum FPU1]GBF86477.1 Band 7 protein [Aphanothece sacrum FPU3]
MTIQSFTTKQTLITQVPASDPYQPVTPNKSDNSSLSLIVLPFALFIFGSILSVWFIKSFLCICKPNEVVILCGRKWKNKKGQEVGYRVLTGGRGIRIPIVETVKRIDVTTTPIRVEIKQAYSKGGTPINIQAIANVKVSSNPTIVGNAIERFLGRDRQEIIRVAKETLEGNLRAVVATLTPEQVNEDTLKFAERITSDIRKDLMKLGIEIDTLKIQNISDDVGYLNSLSREQIALIIRDAEIAESDALSEAEKIEAQCDEQAKVAQTQDQIIILEKQNELRKLKARLEQKAKSEEEITIAAAKERRAKVEQQLQKVRAELERLRLQADEVLPAEAQQKASQLKAKGDAASYEENAKAAALVNDMFAQVWRDMGQEASELFLIEQLEEVLQQATKIPAKLHLNHITVIDNGDGKSVSVLLKVYLEILEKFFESAAKTLGINVIDILTHK